MSLVAGHFTVRRSAASRRGTPPQYRPLTLNLRFTDIQFAGTVIGLPLSTMCTVSSFSVLSPITL
jgi:hypothetical protein